MPEQRTVVALPDFARAQYVNLRGTLSSGRDYKKWWANELYPTGKGFTEIAQRFEAVLSDLP